MGVTGGIAAAAGVQGISSLYGAYQQGQTNNQNLTYQQQHQNLLQSYINQMLQPGINPYSQATLNFVGQGLPSGVSGFQVPGVQGSGTYGGVTGNSGSAGGSNGGQGDVPGGPPGGDQINPGAASASLRPVALNYDNIPDGQTIQQYASMNGLVRGADGQYYPQGSVGLQTPYGTSSANSQNSPALQTTSPGSANLAQYAAMTPEQRTAAMSQIAGQYTQGVPGPNGQTIYNPEYAMSGADLQAYQYMQGLQQAQTSNPAMYAFMTSPEYTSTANTGQNISGNTQLMSLLQRGIQSAPGVVPGQQTPASYLQNGVLTDANGNVIGTQSNGSGGYGSNGQMYQYQNPGAFTYRPSFLGQAPTIGNLPGVQGQQVFAPQASIGQNYQAPQVNFSPNAQAQQIAGLPGIQAGMVNTPQQVRAQQVSATGTQALNTGQDALMQMLRSNLAPASDPSMSLGLQTLGSGKATYDQSGLFSALKTQADTNLDDQVAKLQGSAGSLGQRFGSAMGQNEAMLRSHAVSDLNATDQQIGLQAFESAQGNQLGALNTSAGLLNQQNQVGMANQSNQLSAANALAGFGQQGSQLNLQAALANQSAGLQAGQINSNMQLQTGLANQSTNLAAQQGNLNASLGAATANQGTGLQASLADQSLLANLLQGNQSAAVQTGLAGQNTNSQLAQFNAGQGLQANTTTAQLGQQAQTTNLQSVLQALLANQGTQAQFATNNANIANQAGQFNAQMGQTSSQFGAQQGNIYNNLILQALGQAGNQQNQTSGYNASLLGILNGVGVPQAQASPLPGAISNTASMAMLIPFLNQMYSQGAQQPTTQGSSYPYE